MFNIGNLGDSLKSAKDKLTEKAEPVTTKVKGKGKDKLKGFLADLAGGPGLLNDGGSKYQKPYETKEQTKMQAMENDAEATEKAVTPKSGGGTDTSNPSEDRTDMSSNATVAFMRKKGYNW